MNVRTYRPEDNSVLARLFAETVRTINSADYAPEQVDTWVGVSGPIFNDGRAFSNRLVFVAEDAPEIVGFTVLDTDGHLEYLYVHHLFQRRGVASALLRQIEDEATSRGISRILTEASITALPFFEHMGFQMIAPQTFTVNEVPLLFYRMEKSLVPRFNGN
jgi:putative acetyltransferase